MPHNRSHTGGIILKTKIQDVTSLLGPRELAVKTRDQLIRNTDKTEAKNANDESVKTPAYLVPNLVYKIDPATQQTPGVKVTRKEQKMANAGSLEYTFQVELFIKSDTDLAAFQ